mgnify:CR=1 FL=1
MMMLSLNLRRSSDVSLQKKRLKLKKARETLSLNWLTALIKRILAAPKPQKIVELETIRTLVDAGQVVIAAGGGGIPVLPQNEELKGASAVIEKDLTSGLMAEMLNADMLMILTSVENVSINYGTPDEKPLEHITVADAKKYIAEGQFGENSMLPKMEAAVSFLEKGIGRTAVITSIDSALAGFQGKTGTIIE